MSMLSVGSIVASLVLTNMIFGKFGFFVVGMVTGAYVTQNYSVPNVSDKIKQIYKQIRDFEQDLAKPRDKNSLPTDDKKK